MSDIANLDKENKIQQQLKDFCSIFFKDLNFQYESLRPFCSEQIILYYSFNQRPYLGVKAFQEFRERLFHASQFNPVQEINVLKVNKVAKGWLASVQVVFNNGRSFFCCFDIVEKLISNNLFATLDHIDENSEFSEDKYQETKLLFTYLRVVEDIVKNSMSEDEFIALEDNKITSFSDIKSIFLLEGGICGSVVLEVANDLPLISADQRLCQFLGYNSIEEILQIKSGIKLIHPADISRKKEFLLQQFEHGNEFAIDFRIICKDGEHIWVSAVGKLEYDSDGKKYVHAYIVSINEKIRESEKFFHFIQKNSNGFAIYALNTKSDMFSIFYSHTLYDILKVTLPNIPFLEEEQSLKNKLKTILEESEAEYYYNLMYNSLIQGKTFSYDLHIIDQTSKLKWINASGQVYKNKNGNSFLYIMYTDVTAYKAHTEKLQKLYDNANGSIFTCAYQLGKLEILEGSNSFYKEVGYSQAEVYKDFNNDFFQIIDEKSKKMMIDGLKYCKAEEAELSHEISITSKNGSKIIYYLIGKTSILNETVILDILLINVTETHKAKLLLEKAQNEIGMLYHNIPGAIMRCSIENGVELDFANDGFYILTGYDQNEFHEKFGRDLFKIIYPKDLPSVKSKLAEIGCLDKFSVQFRVITKNSSIIWVDMHSRIICDEQGKTYLYCTCTNITDRYNIQNMLGLTKEKMRIAILNSGILYWDYYPLEQKAVIPSVIGSGDEEHIIYDFVQTTIAQGKINEKSVEAFLELHQKIKNGEYYAEADVLGVFNSHGEEEWRKIRYTNVLNEQTQELCFVGTSESIEDYKEIERRFNLTTTQLGAHVWKYYINTKTVVQDAKINFFDATAKDIYEDFPESVIKESKVHPDDVEKALEMHAKLESGIDHLNVDIRVRAENNSYKWIRVFYSVINDKLGKPYVALGSAIDISEQKVAEEHYNESVQIWSMGDPDAILSGMVNLSNNTLLYIKACDDFDYEISHTITEFFEQLRDKIINDDDKLQFVENTKIKKMINNHANGVTSYNIETKLMIEENHSLWTSISFSTIKHPSSGEIMCFINIKDITKSKVSSLFSEQFFSSQFDFIMYVNYALDTYQLYALPHIQFAFEHISGLTGKFSEDTKIIQGATVLPEDYDYLMEKSGLNYIIERCTAEGSYDIYFRSYRQSEVRHKQIKIFMFDEKSKSFCIGCADVTDVFLQEQQRVENLKQALNIAKQANEAKSSFLASMSHDIRTPMNAIIGMTNLAIEDIENKNQVEESLSVIKSSSEHLLALLNDILEMSRLESGKVVFSQDTFSIYRECEQVYNFFKGIVQQKQQTLKFECAKLTYENVISDLTRFNRVLTNLLGNAVKFTPNEGVITLKLEEVDVEQGAKIVNFRITVSDTGIGISENGLKHIFDAFHREEKSVAGIEGTGLGLAIVKALVDYQGGEIRVESELGKGSRFIIDLPMLVNTVQTKDDAQEQSAMNITDINLQNRNILLVEDHPINILVATKILEKMGAKIFVAKNGKEGFEMFTQSKPKTYDFIFMDLQMPVMNGLEATEAIRASNHEEAKTIPIIAMTANAYAEDVRKSKLSGMNYHIAKPITVESIHACLMELKLI